MRVFSKCVVGPVWILVLVLSVCIVGCSRNQNVALETKAQPVADQTSEPDESTNQNEPGKTEDVPEEEPGPTLELTQQGVTLRWIEKGKLRMSATASEVQGSEVTRVGHLANFSGKLYENGELTATLSAPKAVVNTAKRVVTATGGVTLKSLERDTTVKSQWMKWFAKEQRVVGNGGVKVNSAMGTMEGAAFEADTAMKSLRVMDSAKGL